MENLFVIFKFLLFLISSGIAFFTFLYLQQIVAGNKNNYTDYKDFIFTNIDFVNTTKNETDPKRKKTYTRIIIIQFVSIITSIGIGLTFIKNLRNDPCETYRNFLYLEFQGEIVDKFMDKPNHNLETLVIEFRGKTKEDKEVSLRNYGLYEVAQVGDRIIKNLGDSITYLIHSNNSIDQFKINKSHYCLDQAE